jgi:hypothetical protein
MPKYVIYVKHYSVLALEANSFKTAERYAYTHFHKLYPDLECEVSEVVEAERDRTWPLGMLTFMPVPEDQNPTLFSGGKHV